MWYRFNFTYASRFAPHSYRGPKVSHFLNARDASHY